MIKRIVITIKPTTREVDWSAFGDFINDTFDNSEYETSSEEKEASDLCYIFYGRSETNIVEYFREQTGGDSEYPAQIVVKTRDVAEAEWDVLAEKYDLTLPEGDDND